MVMAAATLAAAATRSGNGGHDMIGFTTTSSCFIVVVDVVDRATWACPTWTTPMAQETGVHVVPVL